MASLADADGVPVDAIQARAAVVSFSELLAVEALRVHALADTLRGAKRLVTQTAREYAERFLFELLQNAYDAHPKGTRGFVRILLNLAEGEHGTVYVANGGIPFTHRDFRSICELAQSNKKPGQGIGNKGVGFKSVLQIAEWPEI